jgi:protein-disulfide isomerase
MIFRHAVLAFVSFSLACATPTPPPASTAPVPSVPPVTSAAPVASAVSAPRVVTPAPSEDDAAVPVSARNPTWGSRLAPVTIIEFADLQCPYSARAVKTLASLRETFGPEQLRIVWKNYPLDFHPNARPAAEAAMGVFAAAGADAFWRFHDLAFQNQASLQREQYLKWAQEAGVRDMTAYSAGLDSHQWTFAIDQDRHEASTLGVSGTPMFYVNGVFVNGVQPLSVFTKIVNEQLANAGAQLAAGVPPERLYAKLAADNRAAAKTQEKKADDDNDEERGRVVFKVPIGKAPALGPATALVTLVEFADFQCPFSARVQPTLRSLLAKYGDKLRIVWRNQPLPFHKAAEGAALAAMEVRAEKGDAAFWTMHDKLFAGQKELVLGDGPNVDVIADLGAAAGANRDRVRAAIVNGTRKNELGADQDLADALRADGTPHFFINGRRLVGSQPQAKFEKVIDEEMGKAQALVARGVKANDVYATLTKEGVGEVAPVMRDLPKTLPVDDPILGNPNAKVTIHEWADFQCPFSGREEPTVQKVVKDYGNRIKLVWHDLPLPMHPDAKSAAQAAREANAQKGSASFWAMHDKLFASQQHLKRSDLDGYAAELGLDIPRWAAALDANRHAGEIDADVEAASDVEVHGTPAFVIVGGSTGRGYFLSGAQGYRTFRRLIERALADVK